MPKIIKWVIGLGLLVALIIGGNFVYGWTAPGPSERDVTVLIKPPGLLREHARSKLGNS
jgi:UPF0755 protein